MADIDTDTDTDTDIKIDRDPWEDDVQQSVVRRRVQAYQAEEHWELKHDAYYCAVYANLADVTRRPGRLPVREIARAHPSEQAATGGRSRGHMKFSRIVDIFHRSAAPSENQQPR
jgi:hypothetical protein